MNEADRKTADIWGHLSSLGTFKASYLTIGGSKLFLAGEPFTLISVELLKQELFIAPIIHFISLKNV